jgi:hypothetical protein
MVMALFAVATGVLATAPIVWLARARFASFHHVVVAIAAAAAMAGSALLIGPWALLSIHLRPIVLAGLIVASVIALRHRTTGEPARLVPSYATAVVFAVVFVDALSGLFAPAGTIDLEMPLEPGEYALIQGGNSVALNPFHHWFPSDRHAIDVVRLNRFGNRARALAPASLSDYAIFDSAVLSPCMGTVEERESDLPDHAPGAMDFAHPPGNHVVLRCGTTRVLLAHMKQGSVVVSSGETIRAGQSVGRVGNSGGTREPHLHLGAMSVAGDVQTATAVPFTINGRYLRMNDVVHARPR